MIATDPSRWVPLAPSSYGLVLPSAAGAVLGSGVLGSGVGVLSNGRAAGR
ncbi:hypothetical protein OOK41_27060 [Micromonospora sp. NBC_01655]|nr:hypothetical protein [Micromonospora sp. NBC_01655]MCX4473924.1 hypothetical protein [Micromonospora sp. NBC_01655]